LRARRLGAERTACSCRRLTPGFGIRFFNHYRCTLFALVLRKHGVRCPRAAQFQIEYAGHHPVRIRIVMPLGGLPFDPLRLLDAMAADSCSMMVARSTVFGLTNRRCSIMSCARQNSPATAPTVSEASCRASLSSRCDRPARRIWHGVGNLKPQTHCTSSRTAIRRPP
jgi:hypothetical protein